MKLIELLHETGLSSGVKARRKGDTIFIDELWIPPEKRGGGFGREIYQKWERQLPKGVRYIKLSPVDYGQGDPSGFWRKMGFEFTDPKRNVMVKAVTEEMRGVRIKTFDPLAGEGKKTVTVLVNEEPDEIIDMLERKAQLRGLTFGDSDTYWWDSYEATHEEMWMALLEIYGKMPVHPWFLEYREGGPPRLAYARMAAEPANRNAGMRNLHISRLIDYIRQAGKAA